MGEKKKRGLFRSAAGGLARTGGATVKGTAKVAAKDTPPRRMVLIICICWGVVAIFFIPDIGIIAYWEGIQDPTTVEHCFEWEFWNQDSIDPAKPGNGCDGFEYQVFPVFYKVLILLFGGLFFPYIARRLFISNSIADSQELVESESGRKAVPHIEVPKGHVEQSTQVDSVHTEQKPTQNTESAKPNIDAQSIPDGKGYEWYTDSQETSWYRNEDSNSEWQRFEA